MGKRPDHELTYRVVRYRRSGIYRAQRLPILNPRWNMTREEAAAKALASNEEARMFAGRCLQMWATKIGVLTRYLASPEHHRAQGGE